MAKSIVVVGTMDTKGREIQYLKKQIEARGHKAIVIDVSIGEQPSILGDVTCQEIAKLGGSSSEEVWAGSKEKGIQVVIAGGMKKVTELYSSGKLDGILSAGGGVAILIGTSIMKALPFGVPKFMVSTAVAMPGYATTYIGTKDIVAMNSVVDIAGDNPLLNSVLDRAAASICGMAEWASGVVTGGDKPLIAMSIWGGSDKCSKYITETLESRGYQVISFHANGISDRAMEELIGDGFFEGVVDVVTAGIGEHIYEGYRDAGPNRLEAAGKRGIPQVVGPSGLNFTGCGIQRKNREKFSNRERVLIESDMRAVARYYPEEMIPVAEAVAEKLNQAKGPVKFLAPLNGWSSLDREGLPIWYPEEDRILIDELKKRLKPEIEFIEINSHLEDPEYAQAVVETFDRMMKERK